MAATWYVGNALLLSGMSWLAFGHAGYGLMLSGISEAQMTLAVVPVVVLLCGWGLQLMLPRGGHRHWTWSAWAR